MFENAHEFANRRALLAGIGGLAAGGLLTAGRAEGGSLTPPGAPSPSPKPLLEVEPRTAVNKDNTPGSASAHHVIDRPGSYYLMDNVVAELGENAIEIRANGVTLDLRGFAVLGAKGGTSPFGILVTGEEITDVAITDGTVRGFGTDGVNAEMARNVLVDKLRCSYNGGDGIHLGAASSVLQCVSFSNGGKGIFLQLGGVIKDCAVAACKGWGIHAMQGITVADCTVESCGEVGIAAGSATTVTGCSVRLCTGDGILADEACVVRACGAGQNARYGIAVSSDCLVESCAATGNGLAGIRAHFQCVIRNNVSHGNFDFTQNPAAGILVTYYKNSIEGNNCRLNGIGIKVELGDNFVVANRCGGNSAVNWFIAPGNAVAPIFVAGTNADPINGDSYTGLLGPTNELVNYTTP